MTTSNGDQPPINDNIFRVVCDDVNREVISTRLEATLDELAALGAADAAIIEALFKSMTEIVYRSSMESEDNPRALHAMGRYNQLSRISGELEGIKAVLMKEWTDELIKS